MSEIEQLESFLGMVIAVSENATDTHVRPNAKVTFMADKFQLSCYWLACLKTSTCFADVSRCNQYQNSPKSLKIAHSRKSAP